MQYVKFHFKHACVSVFILTSSGLLWAGRPCSRADHQAHLNPHPTTINLYTLLFVKFHHVVSVHQSALPSLCLLFVLFIFISSLFARSFLLPASALLMSPDSPACSEPLPLPHTSEPALRSCCSCSFMSALIAHINITVYRHAAVIHVRECHFA